LFEVVTKDYIGFLLAYPARGISFGWQDQFGAAGLTSMDLPKVYCHITVKLLKF
jgi:hypothetical protein